MHTLRVIIHAECVCAEWTLLLLAVALFVAVMSVDGVTYMFMCWKKAISGIEFFISSLDV